MARSGENEFTTVVDIESGVIKVTAKLVIKNLVKMMAGIEVGKAIESDPFKVGETPMTIGVYVNGQDEEERGTIAIFLYNDGDEDMRVKCQLITDLVTKDFGYDETVEAGQSWGFHGMLTHAQCAEAYKDKDFVVTAIVEIPGEPVKIVGSESTPTLKKKKFNVMERVFMNMERCDFALVFDGEEVPCHKIILASASPYFKAMVENKHKEAIKGKANIHFTADVGKGLVQFIYIGEVPEDLLKEQPSAFLAMGEMFDMQDLKDLAETEMLIQLDKVNMVAMISLGELFRAEKILDAALKMARVNMSWLKSQVKDANGFFVEILLLCCQEGGMEEVKKLSKDVLAKLL